MIGKYIGVMHGAEIESWTYEQIKDVFGEIKQYPVRFNNFCSDDDLNGPLFYMRVLQDFGTSNISERQMGHTLLNYVGSSPFRFHRTKWKNNSRADRGTDFF